MQSHVKLLCDLLQGKKGLALGLTHDERAFCRLLMDSMEELKRLGVKRIYFEHLIEGQRPEFNALGVDVRSYCADKVLDDFMDITVTLTLQKLEPADRRMDLKPHFNAALRKVRSEGLYQDTSDEEIYAYLEKTAEEAFFIETNPRRYNNYNLLKKAQSLGLEMVQLDQMPLKKLPDTERLRQHNAYAVQKISQRENNADSDKYLVVMGQGHTYSCRGIVGVGESLGLPLVDVFDGDEAEPFVQSRVQYKNPIIGLRQIDALVQLKCDDLVGEPRFTRDHIVNPPNDAQTLALLNLKAALVAECDKYREHLRQARSKNFRNEKIQKKLAALEKICKTLSGKANESLKKKLENCKAALSDKNIKDVILSPRFEGDKLGFYFLKAMATLLFPILLGHRLYTGAWLWKVSGREALNKMTTLLKQETRANLQP